MVVHLRLLMSHLGLTAIALALWAGAAAAAPDFSGMRLEPYDPPKPAPALALPDLQGKTRTLADFRGKVVLLFFWATW
jgi:cytochrome oxidase Cu insertion factor (SCO1/SenC/PrrC family)